MAGHFDPAEKRDRAGKWTKLAGLMKTEGGFTHIVGSGETNPSKGIAVGIPAPGGKDWRALPHGSTSAKDIAKFRKDFAAELAKPGRAIGAWSNGDPAEGDVRDALDVVEVYLDQASAYDAAQAAKQDGVFDFERGYLSTADLGKELTMSKKKNKGLSLAFQTPTLHNAEFDLAASSNGQLAFWKQILPMKAIHYTAKDGTRQVIDFTKDYLAGLATNTAVDSLGFLLADAGNKHTMDPERWRGKIAKLEVREDGTDPEASGLWGKVVFPSQEAAKAVLDNPELGVSARIRPNVQRSDGSTVPAGLIHVLGTLDPQVSGMKPWQATDLSNDEDEILDLSEEEYDEMSKSTEGQKAIEDMTEEDLKAMTEAELDAFLLAAGLDPADFADLEDEVAESDEPEVDQNGAKRELVGAELSTTGNKDIDLARQEAADARAETRGLARRVAEAEWKATRDEYVAAGVPPHALDLAASVLNRTDDMVIDLSSLGDEDVNVSEAVRGLLDALKGTVDLSTEEGHFGLHSGDDNPDTAILARWTPGE